MKSHLKKAIDARQTPMWAQYMRGIGWKTESIGKTQVFIKQIPLLTFIKIQHPGGPLPLTQIDQIARKHKAVITLIEPHLWGNSPKTLKQHGFQPSRMFYSHTSTIKIDLNQTEAELYGSFSENARRNIKKAQKQNLQIKAIFMGESKNWRYFDSFFKLLTNLAQTKKFYIPSRQEYIKKMTAFKDTSILLFAYKNKKPIAVVWYAYFDNVLAYFQTGITQKGYDSLANYLLVWEGLKLGQKMGLKVFDFESIFDERFPKHLPEKKRYTDFKKRFHGEVILYPQPWVKTYNIMGKLLYLCSTII